MPDPAQHAHDQADVVVLIPHPYRDVECPLAQWIRTGPGPRPYVRPSRAWSRTTGEELPLTVIPLQYRNTRAARRAVRDGLVPNPWPDTWHLPSQQEEDASSLGLRLYDDPYEDTL